MNNHQRIKPIAITMTRLSESRLIEIINSCYCIDILNKNTNQRVNHNYFVKFISDRSFIFSNNPFRINHFTSKLFMVRFIYKYMKISNNDLSIFYQYCENKFKLDRDSDIEDEFSDVNSDDEILTDNQSRTSQCLGFTPGDESLIEFSPPTLTEDTNPIHSVTPLDMSNTDVPTQSDHIFNHDADTLICQSHLQDDFSEENEPDGEPHSQTHQMIHPDNITHSSFEPYVAQTNKVKRHKKRRQPTKIHDPNTKAVVDLPTFNNNVSIIKQELSNSKCYAGIVYNDNVGPTSELVTSRDEIKLILKHIRVMIICLVIAAIVLLYTINGNYMLTTLQNKINYLFTYSSDTKT